MSNKEPERRERPLEIRGNEPSPLLRLFAIAATRIEGDFEFDEVREQIVHSPQWIAEAKNQEDRHERYVLMTTFILDMLFIQINEFRNDKTKVAIVLEFDELENMMNSCDVISVNCDWDGTDNSYSLTTRASTKKEKKGGVEEIDMDKMTAEVHCAEDRFIEGSEAAKENGYRRINCTARMNYRKAMRLAVSSGFFDPKKALSIRKNMVRAEDFNR